MKVCLLSNSDGRAGGYAAAYRLHRGLIQFGLDSTMVVGEKTRDDPTVLSPTSKLARGWAKLVPGISQLPLLFYTRSEPSIFSIQWLPDRLASQVARISPDIVNLHWVNAGFLQIETLAQFNRPIVWTLHDMWPFTGGCHYSGECDRYTRSCGACPQLGSRQEWDLSRWIQFRKARAWKNLNLTIVTPSRWLADLARNSFLFQNLPIEVIPNGLDIQRYKPIDRSIARNLLGLPLDKPIVLFGSIGATSERRKGFHLLLPALQKLGQLETWCNRLELVVFGSSQPREKLDCGLKIHYLGKFSDDISLALVYAAADVFVAPSIEENLANTVMEALACGTPCVAFSIGGMPDMIEHEKNGYLAKPFEVSDLARGIAWLLENSDRYARSVARARETIEQNFSLEIQAYNYLNLYKKMVKSSKD